MANWVTTELSQQTWTVKPPHDMLGRRRSKIDLGIQFQYVLAFSVGLRRLQLNDLSNVSLFLPFLLSPSNNTSGKALAVLFQKKVHFWYSCSWGNKIRQVRLGTKLRSVIKQPLYQESPCQLFARLSYLPPSRCHQTHQLQSVSPWLHAWSRSLSWASHFSLVWPPPVRLQLQSVRLRCPATQGQHDTTHPASPDFQQC